MIFRSKFMCGRYSTLNTVVQTLAISFCFVFFFLIMENSRYVLLCAVLQLPAIMTWVQKQALHFLQKCLKIKPYKCWTKNKWENPVSGLPDSKPLLLNESCCVIWIHLGVWIQKKAPEPLLFQSDLTASFFFFFK